MLPVLMQEAHNDVQIKRQLTPRISDDY